MSQLLNDALVQPVLELVKRFMDIILMVDVSTSMRGKKMAVLNQAIKEAFNVLAEAEKQHPDVEFRIRCIAFSDTAQWHIGPDAIPPSQVSWSDLTANGRTSTGDAVDMLADAITMDKMPPKGYPPVMVLLSDGDNTDGDAYKNSISRLDAEPWGRKAIRLSIGIGKGYTRKKLDLFTNQEEIGVLEAKNTVDLVNYLRYSMVTAPLGSIRSKPDPVKASNAAISKPPPKATPSNDIKLEVF